jgi:hypothetical protein
VEANYFLGNALVTQADFLRAEKANEAQKALQEARAAFEAGAKLAADHKLVVWSEFVLFDRAKLDLDEAKRRLLTMPAAQRPTAAKTNSEFAALLSAAAAFADKLKPVNPARAALVLGQVTILKVDPNLATAKRNALDIFAGGLKVARPHDRWLRIDLLRERITLLDPTEDAATLAADRFTAYRLLTEVEAPADQRADMLALSALAQQAVYKTKRAPADRQEYLQRLRMAIREFPDHPNLWGWVYFAADELKNGTADEKAEAIKLLDLGMQKATPEQKVQLEQLKRSIKPGSP